MKKNGTVPKGCSFLLFNVEHTVRHRLFLVFAERDFVVPNDILYDDGLPALLLEQVEQVSCIFAGEKVLMKLRKFRSFAVGEPVVRSAQEYACGNATRPFIAIPFPFEIAINVLCVNTLLGSTVDIAFFANEFTSEVKLGSYLGASATLNICFGQFCFVGAENPN